ncbi:MAG: hypothetical protein QNJ29_08765 [Rhizobiaceae bacterium]|nr:hypothetical protein [Rhizobiaceae bacterium]
MSGIQEVFGLDREHSPMRDSFMRWQCRVRQIAMREKQGRPDDGVIADVTPEGATEALGSIVTVLNKAPLFSKTPELKHMYLRTNDPAQRRDKALQLFSETYYQKHKEFSDVITATFLPNSQGAQTLLDAKRCMLAYEAYNQTFSLKCQVRELSKGEPIYQATYWHNLLFNPNLSPDTIILGFQPVWKESLADPPLAGGR